jgi:DNA invertase Pin-like site-specific DNA recombinase
MPSLSPSVRNYLAEIGSKGGQTRARRHARAELRAWARKGGRPARLAKASLARLRKLRAAGKTIAECADILGVSRSTVARAVSGRSANPRAG